MPYCPACYLERLESRCSCPLDGHYYCIVRCRRCGGEIAPEERFCVHCGSAVDGGAPEVVAMPRASWGSRALALVIDLLCISYVAAAFPSALRPLLRLTGGGTVPVLMALLPLGYFAVYQARGRQTIGQQVMGLAVLGADRRGVGPGRSLLRAALLYAALLGTLDGLLGILASRLAVVADALHDLGIASPWVPATAMGQGVTVLLGAAFLLSALATGRMPHDLAADTEVYAV